MSEIKDKRFNDPFDPDDGLRVLICRIRPRGISKQQQTWHEWEKALAPSLPLLKQYKAGALPWPEYENKFLKEMESPESRAAIARLNEVVKRGRPVTLLCASACTERTHCHRSLVRRLMETSLLKV